ncbi:MAG: serine/threonine protein kinase [Bdellovibrionota bacterium]
MKHSPWGSKETAHFYELTPDKILTAVESLGYRCTGRCLALNSMENRVFDVEIEVDNKKEPPSKYDHSKIIKFYRPGRWSSEQILDEHEFLANLHENEIPVVLPEKFPNGSTLNKLDNIDIYFTVFPKIGGRSPDELSTEQLQVVGRLLARLHNVGESQISNHRIKLDEVSYGEANLKYLIDAKTIPIDIQTNYQKVVENILQKASPLFESAESQRIHGDCHLGNLLWGQDGAFWVDFDDMVNGPCVQDIWLICPGRDNYGIKQRNILLDSYKMMRDFDDRTLALIEPLRALRFIHFSAWISKRWKDPSFPKAFPNFNSWEYWTEQLRDLQEQLRLIEKI